MASGKRPAPPLEDVIDERLERMSPLIRWCALTSGLAGVIGGAILTQGYSWLIPLALGLVAFVIGVVIGVTLDVLLLKPRRDRELRERRRRKAIRRDETESR